MSAFLYIHLLEVLHLRQEQATLFQLSTRPSDPLPSWRPYSQITSHKNHQGLGQTPQQCSSARCWRSTLLGLMFSQIFFGLAKLLPNLSFCLQHHPGHSPFGWPGAVSCRRSTSQSGSMGSLFQVESHTCRVGDCCQKKAPEIIQPQLKAALTVEENGKHGRLIALM